MGIFTKRRKSNQEEREIAIELIDEQERNHYSAFRMNGIEYKLGDTIYLLNPTGNRRRIIMITQIKQKSLKPMISGYWLNFGDETITSRNRKITAIKDMKDFQDMHKVFD